MCSGTNLCLPGVVGCSWCSAWKQDSALLCLSGSFKPMKTQSKCTVCIGGWVCNTCRARDWRKDFTRSLKILSSHSLHLHFPSWLSHLVLHEHPQAIFPFCHHWLMSSQLGEKNFLFLPSKCKAMSLSYCAILILFPLLLFLNVSGSSHAIC